MANLSSCFEARFEACFPHVSRVGLLSGIQSGQNHLSVSEKLKM